MKKSKIWIPIVAIVLSAAVIAGVLLVPRMPRTEVAVYPVSMVGYTDYYGGTMESYGMVTTDKVQTLYVSGTQTITEILVYPGQTVKKGDVLFTYDTTLSDLAIERKDLANQQLEVELKTAQAELAALKKMKPIQYKPGSGSSNVRTDYTRSPADKNLLNTVYSTKTTGKSSASPLYFWLQTNTQVTDEVIEYIFSQAQGDPNYVYVVFQMSSGNRANTEFSVHSGVKFTKVYETTPTEPTQPTTPTNPTTPSEPSDPTTPSEPSTPTVPSEPTQPTEPSAPSEPTEPSEPYQPTAPSEPEPSEPPAPSEPETPSEPSDPTEPSEVTEEPTESTPMPAQEKVLTGYSMTFFDPPSAPNEDSGTVEWNDGYTAAELTAMKNEKQAQIKQLQFDIKMGKAELKIMKKEAQTGKITAEFAGVVSDILDPATALISGEPLMKVTGGGGYYVEGTVSELALDTIRVGQSVTINSWDTGMVYTGTIREIGTYPTEGDNYYGSANVTYYPYKVFIDQSADLQDGMYVSMICQSEEQAAGILYLQNAFLRSEGNRSYVFVRGAEGLLEKRYLSCGVSDGYMTPVYSGITEEDFVAFPYGNDVVEQAPTYEGSDQDLYGY